MKKTDKKVHRVQENVDNFLPNYRMHVIFFANKTSECVLCNYVTTLVFILRNEICIQPCSATYTDLILDTASARREIPKITFRGRVGIVCLKTKKLSCRFS